MTTVEQQVHFTAGTLRLEGRLFLPPSATAGAVICHPHPQFGGSMENNVVTAVAAAFQAIGLATLRFNFRGVGASEGGHGGGAAEVIDAQSAVEFLRTAGPRDVTLAGYSFGAAVAARAVHESRTIATPTGRDEPASATRAAHDDTALASRVVLIAPPLAFFSLECLEACLLPKLIVAGEHDSYCSTTALREAVARLPEPKTLVTIPRADHFFFGAEDALVVPLQRFCADAVATN